MKFDHQKEDAPFNFAMLYYLQLNDLIRIKNQAAVMQDWGAYLTTLNAIYTHAYFKIEEESTAEEAGKILDRCNKISATPMPAGRSLQVQVQGLITKRLKALLPEADRLLMKAMDNKKMIFPRIEITGGIAALTKKYQLGGGEQ